MARYLDDDEKQPSGIASVVSPPGGIHSLLFGNPQQHQTQQQQPQPPPGMMLPNHHTQSSMGHASQTITTLAKDLDQQLGHYQAALQNFRDTDRSRDEMITHLIRQYQDLLGLYKKKCDDFEQERMSLGMWQRENSSLLKQVSELKLANESNPLVFVIIDGDGAVFRDDLLCRGEEGGAQAAYQLLIEVKKHVKATYPDQPVEDWTIMVQVVINLEGLARALHASGILQDGLNQFTAFARAFGQANSLFSFIDVGTGKERADHKIRETLRVMIRLTQCRHVIFGPCHDNGYLPVLEPYKRDPVIGNKLSLLETTPALGGFIQLGLRRANFPLVFRSEQLPRNHVLMRNGSLPTTAPPPMVSPFLMRTTTEDVSLHAAQAAQAISALKIMPPPKVTSAPPQPQAQVQPPPPPAPIQAPVQQPSPTLPLQQQPQNTIVTINASSYATAGKTAPAIVASKTINIAAKKPPPPQKFYYLNASSERIDEELPRPMALAEKRYKDKREKNGRNFCNDFHLRGYCAEEEYCKYEHGDPLPPNEILIQQHRARGTYCEDGTDCEDFDCYYSHHCRFGRDCGMGYKCKFNDTHHMDLRKAVKVYEDGHKDQL